MASSPLSAVRLSGSGEGFLMGAERGRVDSVLAQQSAKDVMRSASGLYPKARKPQERPLSSTLGNPVPTDLVFIHRHKKLKQENNHLAFQKFNKNSCL